jgi:hypothetical protein
MLHAVWHSQAALVVKTAGTMDSAAAFKAVSDAIGKKMDSKKV